MEKENKPVELWYNLLSKALKIPGTIVNYEDFIKKHFQEKISAEQMEVVLISGTEKAGITDEQVNEISKNIINNTIAKISGLSFLAGIPGGLAGGLTIPADTFQYYINHIILIQKLAYLHGYNQFLTTETDSDGLMKLTLFFGVMYGVQGVEDVLGNLTKENVNSYIRTELGKTNIKFVVTRTAKFIGLRIIKTLAKNAPQKLVPILGGAVSGTLSYLSTKKTTEKLLYFFQKNY